MLKTLSGNSYFGKTIDTCRNFYFDFFLYLNFPISLAIVAVNLLPAAVFIYDVRLFYELVALLMFFGFALMAWIDEKLLHRVLKKYLPERPEDSELHHNEE